MVNRFPLLPMLDAHFLRQNWRALAAWPLVCLCFGALLWYATLGRIAAEKELVERNAVEKSVALAAGYAMHVGQITQQVDRILLELAYHWRRSDGSIRLEELARTGAYPEHIFRKVAIIDAQGKVVSSTLAAEKVSSDAIRAVNVRDRDYFAAHRADPSEALRIGVVTKGKLLGKPVIQFTRRLNGPGGDFNGVVLLAIEPDWMTSYYKLADIGNKGLIALMGSDGFLRASRIGGDALHAGDAFEKKPPLERIAAGTTLMEDYWFRDRTARFMATATVAGFPLIAVAGVSRVDYFAASAANWTIYRRFAYASSFLLLTFAMVATFLAARLAYRQHIERVDGEAYRLATENSRECFYLLRALFDRQGDIVDFQLIDCNEPGAALFGLTRDAFTGAKVSDFYQGDYLNRMMNVYLHAMKQGYYEDEYRVPNESPMVQSQWLHRKFVRTGVSLAMTVRDITESKAYQHGLLRMANEDALTGLPNRHWLTGYLPQAIRHAASHGSKLGFFFIDLDGFKGINDQYGHLAGDAVLREVARRLQSTLRQDDRAVRIGGDEFAVIVEQVLDRTLLEQVATRLCETLSHPLVIEDGTFYIGASVGISVFPEHGETLETLLATADEAMYGVKRAGKGRFAFYSPEDGDLFG